MGKLIGIFSAIGLFAGKVWRIIKAVSKLKKLKKEVLEFYEAGQVAYKNAESTLDKLKGYLGEGSDGGKKLTANEVKEAVVLLTELSKDLKLVYKEGLEAKDEIKKLIDSFKKEGK